LYSAIAQIRSPEKNIVTLEDPIEVQLPGITQVGVSEKTGMTFSRGLRSILRQDPDIILVGEVRDSETAELALKASMTGHLVLTTLHTNSAVAALTRLVDMGAEPFLVASSLTCAIAQRLVRVPCSNCAAPYVPSRDTLTLLGLDPQDLEGATPLMGTGCPECGQTGYKGRIGDHVTDGLVGLRSADVEVVRVACGAGGVLRVGAPDAEDVRIADALPAEHVEAGVESAADEADAESLVSHFVGPGWREINATRKKKDSIL